MHKVAPLFLFLSALPLAAQETREESIARDQDAKAANPPPPEIDKAEAFWDRHIQRPLRLFLAPRGGLTLRLGGLITGSGFAAGPMYTRPDLLGEKLQIQTSLVGSFKEYWAASVAASLPHLFGDRMRADVYARHADSPQMHYYGAGPNSRPEDLTNYRMEETSFDGRLAWRPDRRHWNLGFYGGYLAPNVGPGTDSGTASTETRFTPIEAPGINRQASFIRYGPYVEADYRDQPASPHRGGNYVARLLQYNDRTFGAYSFRRFDGWTEQYIPFFNEKRVIALRAATQLTWTDTGQQVPFFLQPTIGGADDLRGYARFRYYDNNNLVLSSEYRWEVAPPLDMALFVDAGRVFPRPSDFSLNNLRYSGGFGFRVKARSAVVMRMDIGFSREGWQIWFKFSDAYARDLFQYLF